MLRDAAQVDEGATLQTDVCIIGAGAAGITIAQALAGEKLRVILLESGGLRAEPDTQGLYRGVTRGPRQAPLDESRLRFLGGTTNHWAGACGPLDALDFAKRAWVPDSGWPLSLETLAPAYRRAHEICDLGAHDYGEAVWGAFAAPVPGLAEAGVEQRLIQYSPPTRFGEKYRAALRRAPNVDVVLHANVLELVAPDSRAVQRARVQSLAGRRFEVSARRFVVACGAIENARLLLLSNGTDPSGLGNDRDLVGRCFMDHPRVRPAGLLLWSNPDSDRIAEGRVVAGVRARLRLVLGPRLQRRHRVLNSTLMVEPPEPVGALDADEVRDQDTARLLARFGGSGSGARISRLWLRSEQSPNRASRVLLSSDERDRFDQPRPILDWQLQALERTTFSLASRLYARALTLAGVGRVKLSDWLLRTEPLGWQAVSTDWHQMGTTRMATDRDRGVVDADCRVFGVENLFIAGASVFPTSGAMNPTLTLVALALRLADHLRTLAKSSA